MENFNTVKTGKLYNLQKREKGSGRMRHIRIQNAIALLVLFTSVNSATEIPVSADETFVIDTEIKANGEVKLRVLKDGRDSNITLGVGDKVTLSGSPIDPGTHIASQVAEVTFAYVHHKTRGQWWRRRRVRVVTPHARTLVEKVSFDSITGEFKLTFELGPNPTERNLKVQQADQTLQVFDQGPLVITIDPASFNVPEWNPTPQELVQRGTAPGFESFQVRTTKVVYPGGSTEISGKRYSVEMFKHKISAKVDRQ